MTIIVTGGAGFIGSNFVFHMLNKYPEYRIVCLDKLTYAGNLSTLAPVMDNPNFRFVKADICDREAVYKLFEEEKPDMVISLHACDIATDIVLNKAADLGAKVILSTPCCHHDLNRRLNSPALSFVAEHSMLRQKLCDAATDALRLKKLEANGYDVLIVDSIQAVYLEEMNSSAGSVGQIKECASRLMRFAKSNKTTVFIIGHVTKEGAIAGPKVLEHIVDKLFHFADKYKLFFGVTARSCVMLHFAVKAKPRKRSFQLM